MNRKEMFQKAVAAVGGLALFSWGSKKAEAIPEDRILVNGMSTNNLTGHYFKTASPALIAEMNKTYYGEGNYIGNSSKPIHDYYSLSDNTKSEILKEQGITLISYSDTRNIRTSKHISGISVTRGSIVTTVVCYLDTEKEKTEALKENRIPVEKITLVCMHDKDNNPELFALSVRNIEAETVFATTETQEELLNSIKVRQLSFVSSVSIYKSLTRTLFS